MNLQHSRLTDLIDNYRKRTLLFYKRYFIIQIKTNPPMSNWTASQNLDEFNTELGHQGLIPELLRGQSF